MPNQNVATNSYNNEAATVQRSTLKNYRFFIITVKGNIQSL